MIENNPWKEAFRKLVDRITKETKTFHEQDVTKMQNDQLIEEYSWLEEILIDVAWILEEEVPKIKNEANFLEWKNSLLGSVSK